MKLHYWTPYSYRHLENLSTLQPGNALPPTNALESRLMLCKNQTKLCIFRLYNVAMAQDRKRLNALIRYASLPRTAELRSLTCKDACLQEDMRRRQDYYSPAQRHLSNRILATSKQLECGTYRSWCQPAPDVIQPIGYFDMLGTMAHAGATPHAVRRQLGMPAADG